MDIKNHRECGAIQMVFPDHKICDAEGTWISVHMERNIDTDDHDSGIADHCIKEI